MSAPEPQVRVNGAWYMCETCGDHTRPWNHEIPGAVENAARVHAEACVPLQLARLQARWGARDTALRALITQWRELAAVAVQAGHERRGRMQDAAYSEANTFRACAAELERAIGGGRD